jgi:hypothetical protein
MDDSTIPFLWSDAWLLLAIVLAAGEQSSVHLKSVVQLADGIQHAIPTKDEMDGALGRLQRAGYLRHVSERVELLVDGREFVERTTQRVRSLLDQQHAIERALQATPWSATYHPSSARGGEADHLSADEWDRLMAPYRH